MKSRSPDSLETLFWNVSVSDRSVSFTSLVCTPTDTYSDCMMDILTDAQTDNGENSGPTGFTKHTWNAEYVA